MLRFWDVVGQVVLPNLKGGGKSSGPPDSSSPAEPKIEPHKLQSYTAQEHKPCENAVQCDSCSKWTRSFKFMLSMWIPNEDDGRWARTCAHCLAAQKHDGQIAPAIMEINNQRVRTETDRSSRFKAAREDVQLVFPFVSSGKEVKRLTRRYCVKKTQRDDISLLHTMPHIRISGGTIVCFPTFLHLQNQQCLRRGEIAGMLSLTLVPCFISLLGLFLIFHFCL